MPYKRLAEGVRRHVEPPLDAAELTPYEFRVFSQNGEDGVIAEIFRRAGTTNRFFVEFGAEDGRQGNAALLADALGWSGLLIESDPTLHAQLESKHRPNPRVRTRHEAVTAKNLERILAEEGVPPELDLLSIDVDGNDYWIWVALEGYRPRLVVIEYNAALDPDRRLVQPHSDEVWDGTEFFGASLGALQALGEEKGYRLVHTELTGVNAFFVREELADLFPATPPRRPPNYFFTGKGHPPDPRRRDYLDLEREP